MLDSNGEILFCTPHGQTVMALVSPQRDLSRQNHLNLQDSPKSIRGDFMPLATLQEKHKPAPHFRGVTANQLSSGMILTSCHHEQMRIHEPQVELCGIVTAWRGTWG
jgi:hypothetical protein